MTVCFVFMFLLAVVAGCPGQPGETKPDVGNSSVIEFDTVDDVIDTVNARLIGVIPEDKLVFMSLHDNTPLILYKKRLSAYEFLDVARRITGEDVSLRIR